MICASWLPHNLNEPQCLLRLCKLSVSIAKKTREHIAKVSVCVNDFRGNHCSVPSVRDPLHIILFAHAVAGSQDSRAWGVGLGTNIKR